jgi:hypothetical protein
MLQEAKDHREISATSYNKLGYTTRNPLPDGKTKKEMLV